MMPDAGIASVAGCCDESARLSGGSSVWTNRQPRASVMYIVTIETKLPVQSRQNPRPAQSVPLDTVRRSTIMT